MRPGPPDWRTVALAGASAGLALSPLGPAAAGGELVGIGALSLLALAAARRSGSSARRLHVVLAAAAMALAGAGLGGMRLAAIDRGALMAPPGTATLRGFVVTAAHEHEGRLTFEMEGAGGRVLVDAGPGTEPSPVGREVMASGSLRRAPPWEEGYLRRRGIAMILRAESVEATGGARGGLDAVADGVRERAAAALDAGTTQAEAALLRGFVLGDDGRIPEETADAFKRSGLAHLLAVSGQNVVLLGLLAAPILALIGVPLRSRLVTLLALIALYVPVTGAGPSIQRAGLMGAAGLVAALAGRPRVRWHALLLACCATLALNPRFTQDPGWELSFAAVIGILVWSRPIRDALLRGHPGERRGHSVRSAVADGAAVTIAATVATAPLMAYRFGALSLVAVPANLLALPAVAPVMWLGMLAAAAGQVPGLPMEPLSALAGLLAAYIAQVAHWLAAPGWSQAHVPLDSLAGLVAAYGLIAFALGLALAWHGRRRGLRPDTGARRHRGRVLLVTGTGVLLALSLFAPVPSGSPPASPPGLRIAMLDVGQGDAILLDPADGAPVLVDGGPPGSGIGARLGQLGVSGLAAAVVTHAQADHAGGVADLIGDLRVRRVLLCERSPALIAKAARSGVRPVAVSKGTRFRSGELRVEVLWPPRERCGAPGDPNAASLVLLARWHGFEALLTGDAEAELAPVAPGAVDVLKVAHHGSEDAGLDALLGETRPALALVSVGAGNSYGHPSPATLETLAEHGVPVARTDLDGEVTVEVDPEGWSLATAR